MSEGVRLVYMSEEGLHAWFEIARDPEITHIAFPKSQAESLNTLAETLRVFRDNPMQPAAIRLLMDVIQSGSLNRALGEEP